MNACSNCSAQFSQCCSHWPYARPKESLQFVARDIEDSGLTFKLLRVILQLVDTVSKCCAHSDSGNSFRLLRSKLQTVDKSSKFLRAINVTASRHTSNFFASNTVGSRHTFKLLRQMIQLAKTLKIVARNVTDIKHTFKLFRAIV